MEDSKEEKRERRTTMLGGLTPMNVHVPVAFHARVKRAAAERGQPMRELIMAALDAYLKDEEGACAK